MHLMDTMIKYGSRPVPLRTMVLRRLLSRWPVGSYEARLLAGAVMRPHYGWCMYHAAVEAKALGYSAVTVIELGVAGGNGLICLCQHRKEIEEALGVEVLVVGFDRETGLPESTDSRDLPYFWPSGSFKMDRSALEMRLAGRAELILGDISRTSESWNARPDAPLGAVLFDLDLYTSTTAALAFLTKQYVLPRVWCYFDDICGGPENAITDSIGEREAIKHFNQNSERRLLNDHLSPAYAFSSMTPESWHQQVYLYHRLNHPDYNKCKYAPGERDQLGLRNGV